MPGVGTTVAKKCLPLPSIFQVSSLGFEVDLGHFESPKSSRMSSGFFSEYFVMAVMTNLRMFV